MAFNNYEYFTFLLELKIEKRKSSIEKRKSSVRKIDVKLKQHSQSVHEGKKNICSSKYKKGKLDPTVSKKKEKCLTCNKKFASLQNHNKYNHPKIEKCNFCDQEFLFEIDLKSHIELVHVGKKYYDVSDGTRKCIFCNKEFVDLRNHIRSYHNHQKKCKLCPQEFVFDIDLQKHVELVHEEAVENRDNLKNNGIANFNEAQYPDYSNINPKKFDCDICFRKYSSNGAWRKHLVTNCRKKIVRENCSICGNSDHNSSFHTRIIDQKLDSETNPHERKDMRIKPIHEGNKQNVERDFDSWEGHVSKNEEIDPLSTNSMDNDGKDPLSDIDSKYHLADLNGGDLLENIDRKDPLAVIDAKDPLAHKYIIIKYTST